MHYGGSVAYQAGLDWLEANDKPGWIAFNRRLVVDGLPVCRGQGGPFYSDSWWYTTETEDREGEDGQYRPPIHHRTLTVPEEKLPRDLNERIVLLTMTNVRGGMVRWAIRRKLGRTMGEFYEDCGRELSTVSSCYVPWQGEWLYVRFNGTGQQGHGYSKHFAIRVGEYGEEQTKLNHRKIVPLARRVFKVPDIYRETVDEETGQATFF
jgi:hypothetical protein